jgi:hypothetical protein
MFMEKEEHRKIELKRLIKLKNLVATEIKEIEQNDSDLDMTISDLEEWLKEIETEITRKQLNAYIH